MKPTAEQFGQAAKVAGAMRAEIAKALIGQPEVIDAVLCALLAGGHLLVADEINRAPAKTQAALLEVMQEGQVTIEGEAHRLEPPFMVLATQNPIEQEGTYALPEAQLDRFLLKVRIDYPSQTEEIALVRHVTEGKVGDRLDVEQVNPLVRPAT